MRIDKRNDKRICITACKPKREKKTLLVFLIDQRENNYNFLFNNFFLLFKVYLEYTRNRDLLGITMIVTDEVYIILYMYIHI